MIPFFAAGLIVLYAINSGANAMMKCESREVLRGAFFRESASELWDIS